MIFDKLPRYVNRMRDKYSAKWCVQIEGMNSHT